MHIVSNTVYFHIGTPKTGTTALQSFLFENEEMLNSNGFSYPHILSDLTQIPFSREHIRKNGAMFYGLLGNQSPHRDYWEMLCDYVSDKVKDRNVIISAEDIVIHRISVFQKVCSEFQNIHLILYLRRQDRLIESLWNQEIKAGGSSLTFEQYANMDPEWLYYDKVLEELVEFVGEENITVRIYDSSHLRNGRIEDDFISILGMETDIKDRNKKTDIANSGLSNDYIEIKRLFNEIGLATDGYIPNHYRYVFEHLSEIMKKDSGKNKYFSPDERNRFLSKYKISNQNIKHKFFPNDETLFDIEGEITDDYYEVSSLDDTVQMAIKSFSGIIIDFDKRLTQMSRQILNLRTHNVHIIESLATGKDIVILGAGKYGRRVLSMSGLQIADVYDNNYELENNIIDGYIIKIGEDIQKLDNAFVILCAEDTFLMEKQMNEYGFIKNKNYILAKEYLSDIVYEDSVLN